MTRAIASLAVLVLALASGAGFLPAGCSKESSSRSTPEGGSVRSGSGGRSPEGAPARAGGRETARGSAEGAGRGGPGGRGGAMAFPVEVVPVAVRPVEYSISAVGSIEAFEIVQVTARVPGAVEKVHFREGSEVREGDVLVEIEPERYRLIVEEARAALEKAQAELAEAEAGLGRREGANEKTPGLIPGEELGAWRTRARTARAEVQAMAARLELAERNARDATARAPFAGTIQTRDVQTGQYVQPGALLTTLVRRDPLLLRFEAPEMDAAHLAPGMTARFRVRNDDAEHEARIVHVAESADPASRMIKITAEVAGPGRERIRPGSFAEVVVPIGEPTESAVIPQTAVRPSERGFLAYVVAGGVARERVLSLGLTTADGLVQVRSGLEPAESLVVRGAEALQDGARVRVVPDGGLEERARGRGPNDGNGSSERPAGEKERAS